MLPRLVLRFALRVVPLLTAVAAGYAASPPAQRPLTHEDFDTWRAIATPVLSRDGRWLAYSFMPQDGDGDLVIRELATGKEQRQPVGALPPPSPLADEANPEAPPAPRAITLSFTSDSRALVATTFPLKADTLKARKEKKKSDEMPKGGLVIVDLATGAATRIASVKSMQVPAKGGAWVAYLKEGKPEEKKADENSPENPATEVKPDEPSTEAAEGSINHDAVGRRATAATGTAATAAKPEFGSDLVLRDLAAPEQSAERVFPDVLEYSFARDGKNLLFAVAAKAGTDNGVYSIAPGEAATPSPLLTGKGRYLKLAWDREQSQLAFVSDRDNAGVKAAPFKLYHWARGAAAATEMVSSATANFPAGFTVSDKAAPAFSRDGKKLYVPAARPAKPPRTPAATPDEESRVTADLWRWNDDFVQPMQKVRATAERNRSYRGVLDLASRQYTQLADPTLPIVTPSDDGTRVLGSDDRAYRSRVDFDGRYQDVYLVNSANAERKLAVREWRGGNAGTFSWSPDSHWAYFYRDNHWHVLDAVSGATRNLTESLGVAFQNEESDSPEPDPAYGAANWVKDSRSFLVYDRYDVWQIFPDGRPARNLTAGHGRATKTQLRVQRIEPVEEGEEERGFDPAKPLTLRGESEETRATGFFQTRFTATTAPQRLLWGDKNYRYVGRSLEADVLLVSASRFDEFPDLSITNSRFEAPAKVTAGGAQLAPFAWGRNELVSYRNTDGVPLRATLYKPANFDPAKKYPLIVYLYERLSQNVNNFVHPAPGHNINFSLYTSNGYLVLTPDIVYTTGYPGPSALKCVLPALESVVQLGFVDEKAIGIQGHSWGGYQIAYMITQTNRFRAAEAGAPVGNMTSAYSGIRWGSGLPRQFQYEKTQSRIGRTLMDAPQLFIENSPVFHVAQVRTPLLILSNDNDDAVPWYQGIELFLALRRLGKEAWLWSYNGEFHGLRRRADQKDFARRMNQFFDHYLKGAAAPAWMAQGIPYIEREEEKESFNSRR